MLFPCSTDVFAFLFLIQTERFISVRNIGGRRRLYLVTTRDVDIVPFGFYPNVRPRSRTLMPDPVFQRHITSVGLGIEDL